MTGENKFLIEYYFFTTFNKKIYSMFIVSKEFFFIFLYHVVPYITFIVYRRDTSTWHFQFNVNSIKIILEFNSGTHMRVELYPRRFWINQIAGCALCISLKLSH
jgi:hypothetical protein